MTSTRATESPTIFSHDGPGKQKKFVFKLEGKEDYRGKKCIASPQTKKATLMDCDDDEEGTCWAGEALIRRARVSTVLVTQLAGEGAFHGRRSIGTNLKHLASRWRTRN